MESEALQNKPKKIKKTSKKQLKGQKSSEAEGQMLTNREFKPLNIEFSYFLSNKFKAWPSITVHLGIQNSDKERNLRRSSRNKEKEAEPVSETEDFCYEEPELHTSFCDLYGFDETNRFTFFRY